jgi:carbon-monoxide dehydrogenase medium subunit
MQRSEIYAARSVTDAVEAAADRGANGMYMAGATWIMRAPLRNEGHKRSYVAISKIKELQRIAVSDHDVSIGSCVTHAELAIALKALPELRVIASAASSSANPAVREVATVGGNLSTVDFMAADLVPALMACDARILLETTDGSTSLSVQEFLAKRGSLYHSGLVRRVVVPRKPILSAHARLPLRKAGDYPVAIVSVAVEIGAGDRISSASICVGSVESAAKSWPALEQALIGIRIDPLDAERRAALLTDTFVGREGIEAPGWYRVKVLPSLVRRAFEALK